MQLIPSQRTRRPRAIVILCAVIVAAAAAAALTTWQVSQHQTAAPPAACGSAWTHSLNGQTQLLGADRGALTCFDAAARACRPCWHDKPARTLPARVRYQVRTHL